MHARAHAYYTENILSGDPTAQLIRVGQLIYERGINVSLDGNLSLRLEDGRILLTRSGAHKGFLSPQDCIVVDIEGRVLDGYGHASSEFPMHAEVYRCRQDVGAVIHAHAPYALACSAANIDLSKQWISIPPIPSTDYARPASQASAEVLRPFIESYFWAILPRHGAVCWGANIWEAFCRLESLEHTAKIVLSALSANAQTQGMDEEQTRALQELWSV